MTRCPTCAAMSELRATRIPDGDVLITCAACETTLTLQELLERAYLIGYEEGLADFIAELRAKEGKRNGQRPN